MTQLTIDNSYSQITGLSREQMSELTQELSVKEDTYGVFWVKPADFNRLNQGKTHVTFLDAQNRSRIVFGQGKAIRVLADAQKLAERRLLTFKGYWRRSKALIDKQGRFPSGLLKRVRVFASTRYSTEHIQLLDLRIKPDTGGTLSMPGLTFKPYPEQLVAASCISTFHRGTISAVTGVGKTLIAALVIQELGVRTLIVVPTLALKTQVSDEMAKLFGLDTAKKFIRVENIDSPELKKLTDFDALIIDEAHHVAAASYAKLNKTAWKGIYYRIHLTATPFRSNSAENILFESIAGEVIYSISYKLAAAKKYIVPVEAYYVDLPKVEVEGTTWAEVYSELVVNRKDRNMWIAETLRTLSAHDKATLCLVKEIQHGDNIQKITYIPFASGDGGSVVAYISNFNKGSVALIGTTGVLGEGVDTKPCEYVIIAGLGRSKNSFMQSVGRGLRKYPGKDSAKVIIFRDTSHRWTKSHYDAQVSYLEEEYGVTPKKLVFS